MRKLSLITLNTLLTFTIMAPSVSACVQKPSLSDLSGFNHVYTVAVLQLQDRLEYLESLRRARAEFHASIRGAHEQLEKDLMDSKTDDAPVVTAMGKSREAETNRRRQIFLNKKRALEKFMKARREAQENFDSFRKNAGKVLQAKANPV